MIYILIFLAIMLIVSIIISESGDDSFNQKNDKKAALDLLKLRFANGEIDEEEFEKSKLKLENE